MRVALFVHGTCEISLRAAALALLFSASCIAQVSPTGFQAVGSTGSPALPRSFPHQKYTPHGYIDNPYHSMVVNRSGVIRSMPPLGFGWWRDEFKGSYGGGDRDHVNYFSILQMSLAVNGKVFADTGDFTSRNIELSSSYHTKHVISYDWGDHDLTVSLRYYLPRENTLACLAEIVNDRNAATDVVLHATHIYRIGDLKWWGSNGLTARFDSGSGLGIDKVWAYGDVFVLGSTLQCIAHKSTDSERTWTGWIRRSDTSSTGMVSINGKGPLRMLQSYRISVAGKSRASALFLLSRGKNEQWAVNEFRQGLAGALDSLESQLAADEKFWSRCPVLEWDWPDAWKRGWVYDFETLRMNVRRPLGIFKHPWDAMQVHSPRVVLGETCLDMMTLSYADPELAQEVIYGTFADALMPNVPCAREDGSVNMISTDGSECGTAPMWGFPFHVIHSLYLSTLDTQWVARLYLHLKAYIEWWLKNRTDKEGWLHCNNSWESGQDGSRRFLVAEGNEGAVADFVRTVDVEASMAEAMAVMVHLAAVSGQADDQAHWRSLADQRIQNTRAMFVDGSFRDVDGRTNSPILLKDFHDVMMLAPLTCGVATSDQMNALRPTLGFFKEGEARWLEWPPRLFAFGEAAWNADTLSVAAEGTAVTASRVYERIDSRSVSFKDESDPFSYRVPGVANEFWPARTIMPGGENYGWGATLPMNIIRSIIGFREQDDSTTTGFFLAPTLPRMLAVPGKTLAVRNLHWRGIDIDLMYRVLQEKQVEVTLRFRSQEPVRGAVQDRSGREIASQRIPADQGIMTFTTPNGEVWVVKFE